ncbi:MAG TPA: methyltransferase domain-containing protein, partial [Thermodesulfobacteriota bacterium]|nr:methyltransferase domain-containing protein [Thermodesulfobacteriota bacterium]
SRTRKRMIASNSCTLECDKADNSCLYLHESVRRIIGSMLRPGGLQLTERALSLCDLPQEALVLDAGCGCAATVARMREHYSYQAYGLDVCSSLLDEARQIQPSLPLVNADSGWLPFPDKTFDTVISECVFSLLEDKDQVLREWFRVLRDGGMVILSDLYVRNPRHDDTAFPETYRSCLSGAVSRQAVESLLVSRGFAVRCWEDHSHLLAELAGRIILQYGSLDNVRSAEGEPLLSHSLCEAARAGRYGYYLLIASKKRCDR